MKLFLKSNYRNKRTNKKQYKNKNILAKELAKNIKQIKAYQKDIDAKNPVPEKVEIANKQIAILSAKSIELQNETIPFEDAITADTESIKKHVALEEELKECRTKVRVLEHEKSKLVEEARAKITVEEAKELIIKRWERSLHTVIVGYQEIHTRNLIHAIEELYEKYTTTLSDVLSSRETETQLLNNFLIELGYE